MVLLNLTLALQSLCLLQNKYHIFFKLDIFYKIFSSIYNNISTFVFWMSSVNNVSISKNNFRKVVPSTECLNFSFYEFCISNFIYFQIGILNFIANAEFMKLQTNTQEKRSLPVRMSRQNNEDVHLINLNIISKQ